MNYFILSLVIITSLSVNAMNNDNPKKNKKEMSFKKTDKFRKPIILPKGDHAIQLWKKSRNDRLNPERYQEKK